MIFDPDSDLVTGPDVPDAPEEPVLDAHEIQGNVLPGFGSPVQALLGVRFDDADPSAARRWLAALVPMISTLWQVNEARNLRRRALRRGDPRPLTPTWLNLAVSAPGAAVLGADPTAARDPSFRIGMAAVAGSLGDPRTPATAGHPGTWAVGGTAATVPHALLLAAADTEADLARHEADLLAWTAECGLAVIYRDRGTALDRDKEHFGFRDGISQVGVRGRLSPLPRHFLTRRYLDPLDPAARSHGRPGQPLVWPGQFVFGYPRQHPQDPVLPRPGGPADGGAAWLHNGSLLVLRRLRQDVAAFRGFVTAEAARLAAQPGNAGLTPDRLAALIVGRWPEGTALMRDPDGDDPDPMADRLAVNHFHYDQATPDARVCADPLIAVEPLDDTPGDAPEPELRTVAGTPADPDGRRCPAFAHVRKVNPRDRPTDRGGPDRTLTFQMLRRGIPFGQPYPSDPAAQAVDDEPRGLLFVSYQTSIVDQFERLAVDWMNVAVAPEGDGGHDLLVGAAPRRQARLPGGGELSTTARWVVATGGGYFLSPSVSTLRAWSGGA